MGTYELQIHLRRQNVLWRCKVQVIGEREKSQEVQVALELNLKDECDVYTWRWEEQRRRELN